MECVRMKFKTLDMKLLLLVGVIMASIIHESEGQQCKRPIDIVFALDASGSMTTRDFLKEKRFIQHLSRKFIISHRGTHAGVIVYSTRASIAITLKKHRKWNQFARAVGRIPFERGDTRIDLALRKAQVIFRKSRGGRSGVPKILIVLTDGQQSQVNGEVPQLDKRVLPLRKQGVKVFAIGIGRYVSTRQLRLLVEKPSHLLTARSFDTLRRHIYSIISRLCTSAIPPVYGFYPLNARYRGQEVSENKGPTARFSRVSRSWGPQGQHGGALFLRGRRYSFIEIPNRARGKLDTRTSTSIFLWVHFSQSPGPIVNYRRNGVGVGLFYYGRRTISANFIGRMGYFRRRLFYRGVSSRGWHYVGLTYDHRTGYAGLWIDGRQVKRRSIGRVLLATQYPIRLGSVSYLRRHFQGRVTCLQIYNAALRSNQIKAIRNRCNSPREAIDPCQNRPCNNGGSCIKTPNKPGGFRCRCIGGYNGRFCQNTVGRPTMRPTRRPGGRPTRRPGGRPTRRPTRGPPGPSGQSTVPSGSTRPTRKPESPGTPIPKTDPFRMEVVEYINVFRRIHGVGPVILSDDITNEAQKWALYISSLGTGKTDTNSPYGRTICLRHGKRETIAKECVDEWYNTVKDYDWQDNSISTKSMNFVQMIWKSSLRVGVGVVRGGRGRFYVVVYYDEPGNKADQMEDNVPGFTDVYLMVYGATCDKGFVEYQGKCYKYHTDKVTWEEAVSRSTSDNATLLSLHDPLEVDFIGNLPVKDRDETIWIGLNNRIKESSYMNTDGSGIEYVDWEANEPDSGKERCVAVSVRQTFYRYGTMSDRRCTEKHQFVSRKPLEGIVTYRVTIDVLSLVWVDDLVMPGTLAFLQLKTKFEDAILEMYKGETNLASAMIERFSPKMPSSSKNKTGTTKKPTQRPTSSIPTTSSSNQATPTIEGSGKPTRPSS
ncbi:uncharacterized protein LOC116289461 [Actinia tenebrosa]|uniref:Uncharacterized protein LOC116289461 n=1 Tax=Actinia tenebrosa TaxID=6105 RepID=A0A6P8HI75_ACTTE|nr:uncharacterized protein LOC116289461 [Actinia tenebrosa]